ncbi:Destroys radicals which are normally produced within the cells and which are toxic to biological systems [Vibrio sp. B1REV9]|uniref:superoxide dismutase family protein n=1 Tax=Vibrio sp. B1REV9 TaxID=2751179 RepID=UPI001AF90F1E|nr:superoxide dismutase family protein [Vibrio sp. B1REV9]CAE6938937.1 Destroys radicals which are normally produced within the cells and which are toxic to biological systems [Vibrio sp. B1REV9]
MKRTIIVAALTFLSSSIFAGVISVEMMDLGTDQSTGTVTIASSEYGTVFTPNLKGLPAGAHGFHIHANGSCESSEKEGKTVLGGAAGGHYDPENTGKHGFPWTNDNHLGDLPALYVNAEGMAQQPVLAPRVALDDVKGRALMIHAGGDNHSDHPAKLGGGGARIVCGVIK